MPRLSIITINYNNYNGLKKTIESVCTQTSYDWEYIIVDGGSTDGSKELIQHYSHKFTYWVSEKDKGIYNAMNKGIQNATGEYCLFLNSGDYLLNNNTLKNVFTRNNNEDILHGEVIFDYDNGIRELKKNRSTITAYYLYTNNIWHPSAFIKTVLLKRLNGYDEHFKIAGDYDFFFKTIIKLKASVYYLNFPVTVFNAVGVSSNKENFKLVLSERGEVQQRYLNKYEIKFYNFLYRLKNGILRLFGKKL